jgi:sigma-B regulation protein RsbU (phosphoserine phosphatase)
MTTAAELLWQLLPPPTFSCDRMTVSAILEPCYEIGGDGFDYAIDGATAHIMILDPVGRGLNASLTCAVTLSAIRAARRNHHDLYTQARAADHALLNQFNDDRFVTAILAELDLNTGRLRYINAGHPPPLHIRHGHHINDLHHGRRMPLGLDDPTVHIAELTLQPQDQLLLYTDGTTEPHTTTSTPTDTPRLIELFEHHTTNALPTPETLRRLCHTIIDHQQGQPHDDTTLLLLDWPHTTSQRNLP